MTRQIYRSVEVDGLDVFYREAGNAGAPSLLLLHGFPTSSHMFRDLIPLLSDRFHLVAPDLPGFGHTSLRPRDTFNYTFANLAKVIDRFTEVMGLDRFSLYIFDYGAPTGLRIALAHPERIAAIISQNGNAYEEGLSDGWNPIQRYWRAPTDANRRALRELLTPQSIRWQYTHGVSDTSLVAYDGSDLDSFYMTRPGADEAQRSLPRLREQRRALPGFPGLFPKATPAVFGRVGP